jgi:DNA methylase
LIERYTVRGDLVADPFAGSGTTLRAALAIGRCARSAGCQVVSVALAYSASGQANMTGRELSHPKVKSVIDAFRDKLDHTEASTGRLTQKCVADLIPVRHWPEARGARLLPGVAEARIVGAGDK